MIFTCLGILIRIFSNSYLNVFQKVLTNRGQKSSVINFYTYLGLSIAGIFFLNKTSAEVLPLAAVMGLLGALGNYFIIKALSVGELSTLAPINSYKPVVALLAGLIFLKEVPSIEDICGIVLIIAGTYFVLNTKGASNKKAVFYRLSGVTNTFILWSLSGLLFSFLFMILSKNKPEIKSYKYQFLLILSVGIMQYATNYVFANMNVSSALALFQLSTILSVFLGANIFHEKNLKRKLAGSIIMVIGAIIIITL